MMSATLRRRGSTALLVAAAAAFLFISSSGRAAETPKAFVPAASYDFGTVKQGEKVSHCFELRNQGSAPLKIEKMQLTFPKMTARAAGSIPPGKSGTVCIDLGTDDLSLKVKAQAAVFVNDPHQPQIPLVLTGVVKAPIDLVPMGAVLASVWKGDGGERTVTIVNNRPQPLHIRGIETEGQHFTARIETEKSGQVYKLAVSIPRDLAPGHYIGSVYINTDSTRYARIRIPINILVKNEIYTFPLGVNFRTINLAQIDSDPSALVDLAEWFMVKKRAGKFKIKSITSDLPALHITQTPEGESNSFRVDVVLSRNRLEQGRLAGNIHVAIDDPAVPELTVPVSGEIR
jgi:hypothetical protein